MTSRSSCAAFSFTLSLILWHCVLISAQDTTAPLPTSTLVPHGNQQVTVGWVNNPKRRGTLTIIIDCLTTTFACTWTVLHLNIPAIGDSPATRLLRKVKWMAIAIIFPQIIFVKAVCELRFALFTLDKMYRSVQLSPEKFETEPSKVYDNGRLLSVTQTWTVEFELRKRWLYKLLLRQSPSAESTAKSTQPEEGYYLPGPLFESKQVQKWTLTHAYYVNMGGIVAQKQKLGVRVTPGGESFEPVIDYSVVRGDHFADADLEAWRDGHPLRELRISVKDIKDKSKADWIVKTIAIIQIGRLLLDLITRKIGGQPVTQIEMATASLAVFAIFTHLANWWKPKDITQPTAIPHAVDQASLVGRMTEPFFAPRLWSSSSRPRHRYADIMSPFNRIANDELWMDKSNPLWAWSLMVGSCLVFGGIHCIAWSFRFPTRVEQLAWQTAALVSTILPMIAWAGLFLPYLYRSPGLKRKLAEAVAEKVDSFGPELLGANDDWWNTFTTAVNSKEWKKWVKKLGNHKGDRQRLKKELQTIGKLRGLLRDLWRSKQQGRSWEQERIISTIWDIERDLRDLGPLTYGLRDEYEKWIRNQDAFLYGPLPTFTKKDAKDPTRKVKDRQASAEYKAWVQMQGEIQKIALWENWLEMQKVEKDGSQWIPRGEYYLRYGEPSPDPGLFRWIFLRCKVDMETSGAQYRKKWRNFYILVQSFNMVAAILYTVARLMILAIMFSSLRAAPDGVYNTPDWTRFMPSFS